jgi:hypothetical protein
MIAAKVKTRSNKAAVIKAAQAGSFNSLKHAGAALKLTARRSIRRHKDPSPPGRPPHTRGRAGGLAKVIAIETESQTHIAIGPEAGRGGSTIWDLHEFGGRRRRKRERRLKTKKPAIGTSAPIAVDRYGKVTRARITTAAQAERAARITAEANATRDERAGEILNYPARPFMAPALAKQKHRIPQHWKNSVK